MLKRLAIALGLVVLLLLAALIAIPAFVDVNDYKDEIAAKVQDATGRELQIVGDIKLSLFPWLGVELGEVRLANPAGFARGPFARIQRAKVQVKLLPLLQREIVLDTVTLQGLELSLQVRKDGHSNWEDLAGPQAAKPQPEQPPERKPGQAPGEPAAWLAGLSVGGVQLSDGSVHWHDARSGTAAELRNLSVKSSKIALNRPVDVALAGDLSASAPTLSGHVELSSRITPEVAAQRYRFERLRLGGQLSGPTLPGGRLAWDFQGEALADMAKQTVAVSEFSLSTLGVTASGALQAKDLADAPQVSGRLETREFEPRAVLQALGQPAPATADPQVLRRAQAALRFEASPQHAQISDLRIRLDDSTLTGEASVRDFAAPAVAFRLGIDRLDLDRYLPPQQPGKPKAAAPPTAAAAAGALELPLDTLRALRLDGKVTVGRLKASGLTVSDISVPARAEGGLIALAPVDARLYGGTYRGRLQLDARGKAPAFAIDDSLAKVQAGPLVKDLTGKDLIAGTAGVTLKAAASGQTQDALLKSLKGSARLEFNNGAVKGINLAQIIRETQARLQGRPVPPAKTRETDFTAVTGTVTFAGGVARNQDLQANSPYLRVGGSGTADLIKQRLDYRLRVKVVSTAVGQGGEGLDQVKGIEIPVRIAGDLTAPDVGVDSAAIREALGAKAKAQVKRKVEEKKQQIEQRLEDKLRERLKGLGR